MAHGFNHVPGTCFTLGPDHGSAFVYPPERLAEITGTADEGNLELFLIDMVLLICRRQDFTFINHIHAEDFQYLGFYEMSNPYLTHDRYGDGFDDLGNLLGVCHPGDTAHLPDIRGDPLQ